MSLLSTTLTVLCLLTAPQPEVEPFYDHLQSYKIEKNQPFSHVLLPISTRLKPYAVYNYTPAIMDNPNARVDYDSLEHLPKEIREYLIKEPFADKKVILEIYNLNACGLKANQLIELFNFEESKITIAIGSGKYLRLLNPDGVLKEHGTINSKLLPENLVGSIWSVMDDLDTNERVVSLHLFFNDEQAIVKWLDYYKNPPVDPIKTDPIFIGCKHDGDSFVSMGFTKFSFRPFKCLDYDSEPLQPNRYTYCAIEEVGQCDKFLATVVAPRAKWNPVRFNQISYALDQVSIEGGLYLEFGVSNGITVTHIAHERPNTWIHGFDSFVGLMEEWNTTPAGQFGNFGRTPSVPNNVMLHKGFFEESLPMFNKSIPADMPIAFMHVDSDLYSSAKSVFDHLGHRIVPGTIIVFDDFLYNRRWIEHEPKAFAEFIQHSGLTFEYISYTGSHEVVVRIK